MTRRSYEALLFLIALFLFSASFVWSASFVEAQLFPEEDTQIESKRLGQSTIFPEGEITDTGVSGTNLTGRDQFIGDSGQSGIVPCGDDVNGDGIVSPSEQCGLCGLVDLAQESLIFAVYLTVFVGTLMFVYAGFLYITAGGDTGKISKATGVFGKVVVGLIIVLLAWTIVDTILKAFLNENIERAYGPWHNIECSIPTRASGTGGANRDPQRPGGVELGSGQQCIECEGLSSSVPLKTGACTGVERCRVSGVLNDRLTRFSQHISALQDTMGVGHIEWDWRVTEAYPPTVQHQAQCHYTGTCIDANFILPPQQSISPPEELNKTPGAWIQTYQREAAAYGLAPVYEVQTETRKQELIGQGVNPDGIQVVPDINAEHFSVYLVN